MEWDGELYSSFYPINNRRGVSILVRKNCDVDIITCSTDQDGRIIHIKLSNEQENIDIINIYAPNNNIERKQFFLKLHDRLKLIKNKIILTGDFNNVINTYLDRYPVRPNSDVSRKALNDIMNDIQLIDIWRERNPKDIVFSCNRNNINYYAASRIDRFLISREFVSNTISCQYIPYPRSDHDIVELQLDLNLIPRGKGCWIFNNTLLKDDSFCNKIREIINLNKKHGDYEKNLFYWYETLKNEIKTLSIKYGKQNRRNTHRNKKNLIKQINHERRKLQKYNDYDIGRLVRLEGELNELTLYELRGAALRSKVEWFEEGEKYTKFFLGLEKSRQNKKVIRKLVNDEGVILNDQSDILREQVKFYKNLYQDQPTDLESQEHIINNVTRTLSPDESDSCERNISASELKSALFSMKSNKSPGQDGLTTEFYKYFWFDFIDIFDKLTKEIFNHNELCGSMKIGTITLIPKKGDLTRLINWRPISLLNIDYKIISKVLANRLSNVIPILISDDQTCCIPGRDISENVLVMENTIDYVNENNLNGLVLKIDQYKAFDRVNHNYLFKVIEKMGFGPNFQRWIQILYYNIEACIKHNGFISELFSISRGVRQGCPISALLYVLSVEPFHETICKSPYISGIQINDIEVRMFQHADDTTFFVSSLTSIFSILKIINMYEHASGSKCNIDKTELLTIGRSQIDPSNFEFPIRNDFIVILGVAMGNTKNAIEIENWENKVNNCISVLRRWKFRKLSFKGKALVINSLVVSKLVYLITLLHVPSWVINAIRDAVAEFIWCGKKALISYKSLILPINKGGLNLCDIETKRDTIRIKYIGKLFNINANMKLKTLMLYFLNHYESMKLGLNVFNIDPRCQSLKHVQPYYREMLVAWKRLSKGHFVEPLTREQILFQPIFHNPYICDANDNTLFNRTFIDSGIIQISDLMYEILPSQLPAEAVHEYIKFANPDNPISIDAVEGFISIFMNALPESWLTKIFSSDRIVSTQSDFEFSMKCIHGDDIIDGSKLSCKQISVILHNDSDHIPKGQEHWNQVYTDLQFENRWMNIYKHPKCYLDADIDFKIMHNILFTNDKLFKFKMVDSPLCTLCGTSSETIIHLFIECPKIVHLWERLTAKLCVIYPNKSYDEWKIATLFGLGLTRKHKEGILIDYVMSIYKCVIWKGRNAINANGGTINFDIFFHNFFRKKIQLIYEVYRKNKNLRNFFNLFGQSNVLLSANQDYSYNYHLDTG